MQSQDVLEAFIGRIRELNYHGSYYMRTTRVPDKLAVQKRLATLAGCGEDELIITRNTTESLDTVIAGYDWKPGDESVMAVQDYGAMQDMFKLQAKRYGMVPKTISLPVDPQSDDEIVSLYANAITPRTRLLMCCHMVNISGQILPVRKIADMAHARGVDVMVDGAHAFAQLDFRIPDLGADYYGASLHKWLGTPLGAGILYVRREKVAGLWPMFAEAQRAMVDPRADGDIKKLNHTGTHPAHTDLAINAAIDQHLRIGIARKEARLRYLQRYWTDQTRDTPRILINTPRDPARSCAIANVGIEGVAPAALSKTLLEKHRIWTVAINHANIVGVRITPHLFTTTKELDTFVKALKTVAQG
jgi:selenocysteine lyase/cysteine desulfurase